MNIHDKYPETIDGVKSGRVQEIPEDLSPDAMRRMIHELQECRSALLMQNEALRRAQAEPKAANGRYPDFCGLAPMGVCTLNSDGLILGASLSFAKWTGVARGELINQPLTRFVFPEDRDIFSLHHTRFFETGEPQTCELRLLCRDNMALWVNLDAIAMREPYGAPVYRIVLCDITSRKRAEKALAEKGEMYRLIFNSVPLAIYHYDDKGIVKACNHQALSLFGSSEEQVIGLNIFDAMTDERLLRCVKTALSGIPSGFAGEYTSAAGKKLHIDSYNVPIYSKDGVVSGAIVMIEDIADKVFAEQALRESEKNLASMFNAITESVFLLDPQGVLLAMNETAAHRLGSKADGMKGKVAYDFLPQEVANSRRAKIEEVFRTGREVHFEDNRSGNHFKHALYPVFDDGGKVSRLAVFSHNVTGLRMAEQALRESEEKARALLEATTEAVALFNREGIILDMNDAYSRLIDRNRQEIIGKCIWEYFPPEVSGHRKALLEQVFTTSQPVAAIEERNGRVYDSKVYPI